jgi:hypothetical protein
VPVYTSAAREYLREVAQAYHNSPGEVALVLALFGVLIIGLTAHLVLNGRRNARRRREWSAAEYRRIIEEREVPPSAVDALEKLAAALDRPQEKHRLVQEASVFDRAARLAAKDGLVGPETISALRVTLGITHQNRAVPRSTTELPVGSTLSMRRKDGKPVNATVAAHRPEGFTVNAGAAASRFPVGGMVDLLLTTSAGVFRVQTFSQGFSDGQVHLRHREGVNRKQKRRHYRRSLRMQARVVHPSGASEWVRVRDLGGGGASFRDPSGSLSAEDRIVLVIPGAGAEGRELSLPARVVDRSEEEQLCRIEFADVPESDRDRVYRLLFARDAARA